MPRLQSSIPDFFKHVRLVASDMDGTLTQHGKFTPVLLQTLTQFAAAGIPVLIVTGRSAGWVGGLVHYLPIAGAIAENGGVFYASADAAPELLVPLAGQHRPALRAAFCELQAQFPQLQESTDNRFCLTDWTFDVQGLSQTDLAWLGDRCRSLGWNFTYSNVQCHIMPLGQDKASGLLQVLQRHFPHCAPDQVLTVGDSPNDESLFDPDRFPCSIGVANVRRYADQMRHLPAYVTEGEAIEGFCELGRLMLG